MGVAYYIVLDCEEPGFDYSIDGKAIGDAIEDLESVSDRHGLPKLTDFLGQSMSDISDMLGEDIELPDGEEEGDVWFDPEAGIELLDALREKIRAEPQAVASSEEVLEEIAEYRQVLVQAKAAGAKWHLAMDI
jgi:hypothetical protein